MQHPGGTRAENQSETEPEAEKRLTRRDVGKSAAVLLGIGVAGGGYTYFASRPALALATGDWVANSASIETDDGEITAVTFGATETSDGFIVDWEGFNEPNRELDITISITGTSAGQNAGQWTGGEVATDVTDTETLASGTYVVAETSGVQELDWADIDWGDGVDQDRPVDVTNHSEISIEDFQQSAVAGSEDEDQTRERTLDVELGVSQSEEGVEAGHTATATITVTNLGADILVGGAGSFEIVE